MEGILEDMIDGFESRWVLSFTLDPRMITLPEVPEDQEEDVCRVLEIRCKELMWDDETERKWFVQVDEPTSPPQIPHTSDKSHTTNLFGYKKPSSSTTLGSVSKRAGCRESCQGGQSHRHQF